MDIFPYLRIVTRILILLVTLLYSYQFLYLALPLLIRPRKRTASRSLRYAVLIAARNEEAVIGHLLDSILAQEYPRELVDIYVVADNCTDRTADIARAHGAAVYTRFNKVHIGKGYALNYLLDHIRRDGGWERYDAFLIFDADNLLKPDYIRSINTLPANGYQAFCGYRNTKNFGTNSITSSYGLWYLHESSHMNRSRMALGVGCHVNGTGFGFTRELLEKMGGWNFFTLTEDIEFNHYCASSGIKIGYCHTAMLYDEQPLTFGQSWKQRTRWAQGGYQVFYRYGLSMLKGLFHPGWQGWTCMELNSLSVMGYGLSVLTGLMTVITAVPVLGMKGSLAVLVLALGSAYLSITGLAVLTLAMEWKHIRATTRQKLTSVLGFPLFMLTFAPIAFFALFRKFQWEPIHHTAAISAAELSRK